MLHGYRELILNSHLCILGMACAAAAADAVGLVPGSAAMVYRWVLVASSRC